MMKLAPFAALALTVMLATPAAAQVSGQAFSGFSGNSKDPIAIEADQLEVIDGEAQAVFSGNVKIRQGTSLITTSKLVVHYVKDATKPEGSDAAPGQNDIERLDLTGGVVATSKENTATADSGVYLVKTDQITLDGNVVISQGGSVAKGCKLRANLKTNVAKLDSCAGGRVQSVFVPGSDG
ncbi:LPS export ABC transporter periplasmic protein LptC [Rhizobiaceae bacterium]|nr:LPS export ABC transporter periplasmic protein LptC [Rhizobiaceae bacterium]